LKIPKPAGAARNLGIPTVIDRVIQQAVLQRLQPQCDPTFSEHQLRLPAGPLRTRRWRRHKPLSLKGVGSS
jgi:retron-type reverse transcriptase